MSDTSSGAHRDGFVHLHTHTEYSMLDGAARVTEAVQTAADDGQEALGITDHGNLYGVIDFYKTCRKIGIKPVIGTEAYMALESRDERPKPASKKVDDQGGDTSDGQKLYYHLTLLAANNTGYRNLLKLASRAFLEGYYYKPRMDWEMFADHADGLIATTGCLGSVVQQALIAGDYELARQRAGRLQDIFGKENLFVELQDHGIDLQARCNPHLLQIADDLGAPLLATNDLHYVHQHDALAHDALLCVQTRSQIADEDRLKFHGDQHYLKTAAAMRELFAAHPDACDNTLVIAERADVDIDLNTMRLPSFAVPDGFDTDDAYLEHLTFEGAKERWGANLPDAVVERLAYELKVINDMGFSSYFLIVWDLIRHARTQGIRVGPGRGSAAGCAVAFSLRITDLDPIRYDLLFERFLNPSRISMPDIDIDFDDRRRDEMIRYASEMYGQDHVAQIVTFQTIRAKAAVRDAARVLGHSVGTGDRIARAVPDLIMGRDTPLAACLELDEKYEDGYATAAELRKMYAEDSAVTEVVDVALGLEGLRRGDSVHAAAVVISPEPLTDYVPIQSKPTSSDRAEDRMGPIVTQFEMSAVEDLGLLKMDFLGLRTLSVIDDTLRLIAQGRDEHVDVDHIPLDDQTTFKLLAEGDTIGVFQLESPPVRSLLRSLVPTQFEDIAALVALYRPGPMAAQMHTGYADRKNGRSPAAAPHDDLTELLSETYGLMIYQESVMRVAQKVAGYSLAEADDLRKACGKKDRELIVAHRQKFVDGAETTGYGKALGTELFDIVEPFADYAFNKSHAFAYGLIAYQTAFLKANYRPEFMAAVLTGTKRKISEAGQHINDCRQAGIKVLVPDVNESEVDFAAHGTTIRFGLSAVRNVGQAEAEGIVAERKANGPFTDFYDFCARVPPSALNKRYVASLIKAGAFVSLGHPRQGQLAVGAHIVMQSLERRRENAQGVTQLFDAVGQSEAVRLDIPDNEADERQLQAWEKEMLGLYVSSHPLDGAGESLRSRVTHSVGDLENLPPQGNDEHREAWLTIGGLISNFEQRTTRKGDLMATFTVEDTTSAVDVTVFSRALAECGDGLGNDVVVTVTGRCERQGNDEQLRFVASKVSVLDVGIGSAPLVLTIAPERVNSGLLERIKAVIRGHQGDTPVKIQLGGRGFALPKAFMLNSQKAAGPLRELLGIDAVRT